MSENENQASKNRNDALSVIAMAAASLFIAVGGYVITEHGKRLDRKDSRISSLEVAVARTTEHVAAHDAEKNYWIEVIKSCQRSRQNLADRINKIETKPTARADSFTGTQGDRLEAMINELKRQINSPKFKAQTQEQ